MSTYVCVCDMKAKWKTCVLYYWNKYINSYGYGILLHSVQYKYDSGYKMA